MSDDVAAILEQSLDRYLASHYAFADRGSRHAAGWSRETWAHFAELGLLAAPFSAEDGGVEAGLRGVATVMRAFGKGLVAEPYLPTVVFAGGMLRHGAGADQRARYIPAIAAGELVFAAEHCVRYDEQRRFQADTVARRVDDGWLLAGSGLVASHVDGGGLLMVVADVPAGNDAASPQVFIVPGDGPGLAQRRRVGIDGIALTEYRLADLFAPDSSRVQGGRLSGRELIDRVYGEVLVAAAAGAYGAAREAFELTVDYVRTRNQFGKPIATFQAIQHRVAEMFVGLEQAHSMFELSCEADDLEDGDFWLLAESIYVSTIRTATRVGKEAIQLHGAIGLTEELKVGHLFKRIVATSLRYGSPESHLAALRANMFG